jgi:hypothetical protein
MKKFDITQFRIQTFKVRAVEKITHAEYGNSKYAASGENRQISKTRKNKFIVKNTA